MERETASLRIRPTLFLTSNPLPAGMPDYQVAGERKTVLLDDLFSQTYNA